MQQGAYRFAPSARLYADHGLCCQLIDDLPSSFGQTSIQPLIPSDGEYTADTAIGHRPSIHLQNIWASTTVQYNSEK